VALFLFLAALLSPVLAPRISNAKFEVVLSYENFFCAASAQNNNSLATMDGTNFFKDLKISALNCNSLNLSATNKPAQLRKIYAIAKMKSDIILLSDTRLSKKSTSGCVRDLTNNFTTNPYASYRLIYNSTMNKRGTAILIKSGNDISDIATKKDGEENYLALLLQNREGKRAIVVSIYGPNTTNPRFFANLAADVLSLGNYPVLIAGDWNCTVSRDPVQINLDCFNMADIPNARHTELLAQLCDTLKVSDPFRFLWPEKEAYTYVSKNTVRQTRSRIDFFLISDDSLQSVHKCDIDITRLGRAFDHNAIHLDFKKPVKKRIAAPKINPFILADPDLDIIVQMAAIECYAQNLSADTRAALFPGHSITDDIGRIHQALRIAGPDPQHLSEEEVTEELLTVRGESLNTIREILDRYPLPALEAAPKIITDDFFMESLLNNIRNEVTSYQSHILKISRKKEKSLENCIRALQTDMNDPDNLLSAESALQNLRDQKINAALSEYSIYEHLKHEKMTPAFLKLSKIGTGNTDTEIIVDDNGQPFANNADRNNYIVEYYARLYAAAAPEPAARPALPEDQLEAAQREQVPVPGEPVAVNTDRINNFLGEQVLNSPQVQNAKLTQLESESLETEITLHELDEAISECKNSTAPGEDGISYRFLKKFWTIFRNPLKNYASRCFVTGILTNSFNSATIRLIPKKGDTTQIKNWRPISLLNCIYKVLSRAINNRLKIFADKIMSRAQKGFSSSRKIQEVILNLVDDIATANARNIPMAILSIDQEKAFDSISHSFLREVLKFFNFGERFAKMVMTIATNRFASIILPDGSLSRRFALGRGNAQGDSPSPLLFNFCDQILLFKIDLDDSILHPAIPVPPGPHLPVPDQESQYRYESNHETRKANSFADDANVKLLPTRENIIRVREILIAFGEISGLRCNVRKTSLMLVGTGGAVPNDLTDLGFTVAQSINTLGFEIRHDLHNLTECFDKAADKNA